MLWAQPFVNFYQRWTFPREQYVFVLHFHCLIDEEIVIGELFRTTGWYVGSCPLYITEVILIDFLWRPLWLYICFRVPVVLVGLSVLWEPWKHSWSWKQESWCLWVHRIWWIAQLKNMEIKDAMVASWHRLSNISLITTALIQKLPIPTKPWCVINKLFVLPMTLANCSKLTVKPIAWEAALCVRIPIKNP